MRKKNSSNLFKKIIFAFLLSFTFLASGSVVAYAVGNVEAGVYRLNALNEVEYEELISTYSFESLFFNISTTFNFYDVDSNLIVSNDDYDPEACRSGFGIDSSNGNLSSFFLWQDLGEISWHYFAGEKTNSSLNVIDNWYYIELLEDVTTFATSIYYKFFVADEPLLVKTQLGYDKPGDTSDSFDIPAGTYKFNYGFAWPLNDEVEFGGSITYNNNNYSRLRISNTTISLIPSLPTGNSIELYNNGWLVSNPTFQTTGLVDYDGVYNSVASFLSIVNGTSPGDNGLLLSADSYTFKDIISSSSLEVSFNGVFKTGEDLELSYNGFIYNSITDTLYYGEELESNIVYQNGSWKNDIYKYFSYKELITDYEVGSFLAQNLDIYNLEEKYFVKGYYYFNDSLLVDNLLDLSFLSDFSYIHNGTIYNSFKPTYEANIKNGVVVNYTVSLSFYNTNTKKEDVLLSGTYVSTSQYITTNSSLRQIYISPTLVNYDTYNWLNENGLFIYYNDSDHAEFGDLMLVFPDVVIHFFASVLSFRLFGIDVYTAICSILTVVLMVWLIRKLL